MSRTIPPLAVPLLLLAAVSCQSSSPLVGIWMGRDTGVGPSMFPGMILELLSDTTYKANVSGTLLTGNWQADGDTVVLVPRTMNGRNVSEMEGIGVDQMIAPITLQLSADRQSMTASQSEFNLVGDLTFTRG
ncbi:MAG: hypothetical protein IH945_10390 [Armatimonadetes bacterium]|nr:hypothetical protein [Armatimonadota bacterium]